MTELLVVKNNELYFRFTTDGVEPCDMNKASVYPVELADEVVEKVNRLQADGWPDARVMKLTITETPFNT